MSATTASAGGSYSGAETPGDPVRGGDQVGVVPPPRGSRQRRRRTDGMCWLDIRRCLESKWLNTAEHRYHFRDKGTRRAEGGVRVGYSKKQLLEGMKTMTETIEESNSWDIGWDHGPPGSKDPYGPPFIFYANVVRHLRRRIRDEARTDEEANRILTDSLLTEERAFGGSLTAAELVEHEGVYIMLVTAEDVLDKLASCV